MKGTLGLAGRRGKIRITNGFALPDRSKDGSVAVAWIGA
jgi:hypothetical protein